MLLQQRELLSLLDRFGWELARTEQNELPWWADEIWVLRSVWSPTDCEVYLTFLVDPAWDQPRVKGQAVWAVKASMHRPIKYLSSEHEIEISLKHSWRAKFPRLFDALSEFRAQWLPPAY